MTNQPDQLTNMCQQSGATTQTPHVPEMQESVVVRQLREYMSLWNKRPQDNNMDFWVRFASEFFTTGSRRMLCLTSYKDNSSTYMKINRFHQDPGLKCIYCNTMPKRGYEISFHEMPGYFHNKFTTAKRETLSLRRYECRLQDGNILLTFPEAEEETILNDGITCRKGSLAILFAPNNKILSWNFCMRRSEYYIKRSALIPQMCDLTRATREYISDWVCIQDNKLVTETCELAKRCDMKQINELGLTEKEFNTYSMFSNATAADLQNISTSISINSKANLPPQPTGECSKQKSRKRPCRENNSDTDHQKCGRMSQKIQQSISILDRSTEGPSCSERDRPNLLPQKSPGGLLRTMASNCSTESGGAGNSLVNWHQTRSINPNLSTLQCAPPCFPGNPTGINPRQLGCVNKKTHPVQSNGTMGQLIVGQCTSRGMNGTDPRQSDHTNQQRLMPLSGTDQRKLGCINQQRRMPLDATDPLQSDCINLQRKKPLDGGIDFLQPGHINLQRQMSLNGTDLQEPGHTNQQIQMPLCGSEPLQSGCINRQRRMHLHSTNTLHLGRTNLQRQMLLDSSEPLQSGHINQQREMSLNDTNPHHLGHISQQRPMSSDVTDPQQWGRIIQERPVSTDDTDPRQWGHINQEIPVSTDGTDPQQWGRISQERPVSIDSTDPQQWGRIIQERQMSTDSTDPQQSGHVIQQKPMSSDEDVGVGKSQVNRHQSLESSKQPPVDLDEFLGDFMKPGFDLDSLLEECEKIENLDTGNQ